MDHALERQAGRISCAFLALRDAPERQTIAASGQDLAIGAESNPEGRLS
jgi:hypothetical protein